MCSRMQSALGVGLRPPVELQLRRRSRAQSHARGRQLSIAANGRAGRDKSPSRRDVSLGAIAQPPPSQAATSPLSAPGALPLCLPEDLQTPPGEVVPVLKPKNQELDLYDYLRRILTAKVYDLAVSVTERLRRRLPEKSPSVKCIFPCHDPLLYFRVAHGCASTCETVMLPRTRRWRRPLSSRRA